MTLKDTMQTDLSIFVNPDEFGEACILSMDGVDKEINILFDEIPDESSMVEALITVITLKRSDAPYLSSDARFVINGQQYGIVNIPENYSNDDFPTIIINEVD